MDYNTEIRELGYQIQKSKGIVYPSDSTLKSIQNMCSELRALFLEYKSKEPKKYYDSSSVSFYSKYIKV